MDRGFVVAVGYGDDGIGPGHGMDKLTRVDGCMPCAIKAGKGN
jgi:hypothetical protein